MGALKSAASFGDASSLKNLAKEGTARGHSGDVSPVDAYRFLLENSAILVDVRSQPEWQFVGVPNISSTPSKLYTISWKIYPQFTTNPHFLEQLKAENISIEIPVFFLCKTGGRSLDAAIAATAAGYKFAFNIEGGFEGDLNENGQRGFVSGWKASKLPWNQK